MPSTPIIELPDDLDPPREFLFVPDPILEADPSQGKGSGSSPKDDDWVPEPFRHKQKQPQGQPQDSDDGQGDDDPSDQEFSRPPLPQDQESWNQEVETLPTLQPSQFDYKPSQKYLDFLESFLDEPDVSPPSEPTDLPPPKGKKGKKGKKTPAADWLQPWAKSWKDQPLDSDWRDSILESYRPKADEKLSPLDSEPESASDPHDPSAAIGNKNSYARVIYAIEPIINPWLPHEWPDAFLRIHGDHPTRLDCSQANARCYTSEGYKTPVHPLTWGAKPSDSHMAEWPKPTGLVEKCFRLSPSHPVDLGTIFRVQRGDPYPLKTHLDHILSAKKTFDDLLGQEAPLPHPLRVRRRSVHNMPDGSTLDPVRVVQNHPTPWSDTRRRLQRQPSISLLVDGSTWCTACGYYLCNCEPVEPVALGGMTLALIEWLESQNFRVSIDHCVGIYSGRHVGGKSHGYCVYTKVKSDIEPVDPSALALVFTKTFARLYGVLPGLCALWNATPEGDRPHRFRPLHFSSNSGGQAMASQATDDVPKDIEKTLQERGLGLAAPGFVGYVRRHRTPHDFVVRTGVPCTTATAEKYLRTLLSLVRQHIDDEVQRVSRLQPWHSVASDSPADAP